VIFWGASGAGKAATEGKAGTEGNTGWSRWLEQKETLAGTDADDDAFLFQVIFEMMKFTVFSR